MRTIVFAASLAALSVAGASPPLPSRPVVRTTSPLDTLFVRLAKAGSGEEAKPIEDQILTLFLESGSASIDLLMTRAAGALAAGDMDTARQLLDVVTKVAPDYAEGWHQRGKLQAVAGDDEGAIISLQKAVTLNPRQFAAMTELGAILDEYGDKRDALKILRRVETLDPHFADVDREVRQLTRDVEGDRI
ncbi:MAG: tetratricopeptide repeat protein [Rhizomicrobium sp.]